MNAQEWDTSAEWKGVFAHSLNFACFLNPLLSKATALAQSLTPKYN